MQRRTMALRLAALAVSAASLASSQVQVGLPVDLPDGLNNADPLAVFADSPDLKQCNCDCCLAAPRTPSELELSAQGQLERFKCVRGLERSDRCSEVCLAGSMRNRMDYSLFCLRECSPGLNSAGSTCSRVVLGPRRRVQVAEAEDATEEDVGDAPDMPKATWQKGVDQLKKEVLKQAADAAKASREERIVNWDMRRLVMERLRAQTGADLAHGAALGEEVRMHKHIVEQNILKVTKIKDALGHVPNGIDAAVAKAKGDAAKALETAQKTNVLVKAAENSVAPSLAMTRAKTLALIRQRTAALAEQESEAYARRMDWDKPANWPQILAQRASEPYQKAMVIAAQRFSEYRAAAQQAMRDANAATAASKQLESKAASYAKSGDAPMATDARQKLKEMRTKAGMLSVKAKGFLGTARDAYTSMEKWQEASQQAAAYIAQVYTQNHPDRLT